MLSDMNVQSGAGKKKQSRSISRKHNRGGKQKRRNKGGSFLADVSVPAGLLLLNQFMKHRKSKKQTKSRRKKSRKYRR